MEAIRSLENELVDIVNKDKQNWTHFYLIMREIEVKELWKEINETSFTAWVRNFCMRNKIHESIIWNRKKAGKVYESYERVKLERGEQVVPLRDADVSVDALVLLDKINKRSPELAAELTEKAINKEISREDLRNAYKAVRGEVRNYFPQQREEIYDDELVVPPKSVNITAPLIVSVLSSSSSWLGADVVRRPFKTSFEQNKYKLFTEFPVFTGTSRKSRRIDALVAENLTGESWELMIHAIEIKVSRHDLVNDKKYSEYADFADYTWLAVPRSLVDDARLTKFDGCGIIAVDKDNVEVMEQAELNDAPFKKRTLMSLVLRIL